MENQISENKNIYTFEETTIHSVDAKGRLIIPVRFRDVLKKDGGDVLVLTFDGESVYVYSINRWDSIKRLVRKSAKESPAMDRFARHFIGASKRCFFDKQGRILIPPTLRKLAKIEKEVVLVGLVDKFEIWAKDKWEDDMNKLAEERNDEVISSQIASLGL